MILCWQTLEVQLIAYGDHCHCCIMGGAALYTSPSPSHPEYHLVQLWDQPPKIMGTHASNVTRFVLAIRSAHSRRRCRQCMSCPCMRRPYGAAGGRGACPCMVAARLCVPNQVLLCFRRRPQRLVPMRIDLLVSVGASTHLVRLHFFRSQFSGAFMWAAAAVHDSSRRRVRKAQNSAAAAAGDCNAATAAITDKVTPCCSRSHLDASCLVAAWHARVVW